jgi:DNA-binding transcriptional regulator GbsR (MarR family)
MRDTSLAAYDDIRDTLSAKRAKVLGIIKMLDGATLYEISKNLGWSINRVSGRVTELCDLGIVEDPGDRKVNPSSGKNCIIWKPVRKKPSELKNARVRVIKARESYLKARTELKAAMKAYRDLKREL